MAGRTLKPIDAEADFSGEFITIVSSGVWTAFDMIDAAAHHHLSQGAGAALFRGCTADIAAAPQHRCGIGEGDHLIQLVADIEDGASIRRQLTQDHEKLIDFLGGQNASRFIHDQEARVLQQAAQDFNTLFFPD